MKFLVDECSGPKVANWLISKHFDVFSIPHQCPGVSDLDVLTIANAEKRIIITNDKDFGEMIFRQKLANNGVIFMRLKNETAINKIFILENLIHNYLEHIDNQNFIVVTEDSIRIRKNIF